MHDEPIVLDDYQRIGLAEESLVSIWLKSRQIGWSFLQAMKAAFRCSIEIWPGYTMAFTSINKDEAMEKIRFSEMVLDSMPPRFRPVFIERNKFSLELDNGTRIVTVYQPRGKGPADIAFDELAHIKNASDRHTAGVAFISRGGQLTIGSTPAGPVGRFAEVWNGHQGKYQRYARYIVRWWDCRFLCNDVPRARKEAPDMVTADRVEVFGSETLKVEYDSMPEEDFRQEFECEFGEEETAVFPWELITKTTDPEPEIYETFEEVKDNYKGVVAIGVDIGRRQHATEITIFEEIHGHAFERWFETMRETPFQEQEHRIREAIEILGPGLIAVAIDETGLGMELAENLKLEYGSRIVPISFTADSKAKMVVNYRVRMDKQTVHIYPDRNRMRQIHSIKKARTSGAQIIYDVEKSEKHHADVFWSQALALFMFATESTFDFDAFSIKQRSPFLGSARGEFVDDLKKFHKEMP